MCNSASVAQSQLPRIIRQSHTLAGKNKQRLHVRLVLSKLLLNQELIMENSFSGKLKGGKYKQKLHFVPCSDKEEPQVGHEISEPAIFRFLLNEETMGKFDEADEVEIAKMLDVLKDIDKQSKITQVEIHQSSMNTVADAFNAYHVFIVFKSTSETDRDYWWSLEKNLEYIVLQRFRNKENVKHKLKGKQRNKVVPIKKDLKGKGTIKDLFAILWAHQVIAEKYHIKKSNCQSLVTFVGQQITNIGYKYKGKFKYYPPPEKDLDKKMLDLINVITGCSDDWSPLFHLITMGNTDLVDKTIASGKYDINACYNGLTTPLHLAIRLSKTKMVKHLLKPEMNADPTKRDASGRNALHVAAAFTMKEEIFDLLLEHDKVNVDDVDGNGRTALHFAASKSNVKFFQKLLERGANPNIFDKKGRSPLYIAVLSEKSDDNEIIDLLLAHGKVMIDHADEDGQTALHWAADASNVVAVQKLLENGANPNIYDKWGETPLHVAAWQRNGNEIMDLLLANSNVKVDDVDDDGQTALHIAAYNSNVGGVQKLLEKGANSNAVDKSGDSPLLVAAMRRNGIPIIDLLLEAQKVKGIGDVNDQSAQGWTALHCAAFKSNEIIAEHLIKKGADLNCRDNVGLTPLDMAALGAEDMKIIDLLLQNINKGEIEQYRRDERLFFFARHNLHGLGNKILDRLVEKGIQPPCTKTDDCITAESGDEAITGVNTRRFVLDKGADPSIDLTGFGGLDFLIARVKISLGFYDDINGRDQKGATLLLVAIRENNVNAVRRMLEKGADPTIIRNEDGYTLFHVAVINYTDRDILNLLLENGKVDINETTTEYGETALHMAIQNSNTATAEFLLSKGANLNVTDIFGRTPLHLAVKYAKDMDIVELLLNHKDVDVNLMDDYGQNALDYAMENENGLDERIANLLKEKGVIERENELLREKNVSLEKLCIKNYISSNAEDEIERVLSDATVPVEDKIARINEEHLISAITDWDVETVRNLLKNGADISSARGRDGMNALHVASRYAETTDLIDAILDTGKIDINGGDNKYGRTPLHWAIMGTNRDINARHLIRKGADPTIADEEGDTPLHYAVLYAEKIKEINLILENFLVDINCRGDKGRTALHHAIEARNVITVRYLLKKGADPNVADENGATPLHLAAEKDYDYDTTELIDIILETGKCNINGVDSNGRTPLHYAIETNANANAITINVRRLIQLGADPGIADKNGVTPLHVACACNAQSMGLIAILLNTKGVDVNCVDKQGRTPLAYARDNHQHPGRRRRIITRLKEYGAKE
jgi:ankyrin repeat protein